MPGRFLKMLLAGETILLPKNQANIYSLVSDQDLVRFVEPCLAAASIPATTVNWGGDEAVPGETFIGYLAELAGVEPRWAYFDGSTPPSIPTDNRRRVAIAGPCKVHWRDGLRSMYEAIHQRLRAEIAASTASQSAVVN